MAAYDDTEAAEAVLLGTAMAYPARAADVLAGIEPEDFGNVAHREVCQTVRTLLDDGQPCHPVIVAAALIDSGTRPAHRHTHWMAVLADITGQADVPALAPHLRRVILHARLRRDAEDLGTALTEAARSGDLSQLHRIVSRATTAIAVLIARQCENAQAVRTEATGGA